MFSPLAPRASTLAVIVALLIPAALASWRLDRQPSSSAPPIALGIPSTIGAWTSTDLEIEKNVFEILQTKDLIMRRYVRGAESPVYLCVAASRGDRKVAHPPEVCLSAIGWSLDAREPVELARGVRAKQLLLERGAERQVVVYFYAAGTELSDSYLASQLRAACERLRDPDVPCALVRFSATLRPDEPVEGALATFREFAREMLPHLEARLSLREETK